MSSNGGISESAHAAFLREYGLSEADVPLLTMTPNLQTPFVDGRKGFGSEGDPTRGAGRCHTIPCSG